MKNLFILTLLLLTSTAVIAQKKYTVPPSPEERLDKKYGSGLFRTADAIYFDLENDNGASGALSYFNILDWLQGRVAGLQVYNVNGTRLAFIRNFPATIFIDEIRMDASVLNMLPVADIALIKVIKSPFVGGIGSPAGAIVIYTKKGDITEEEA